MREQFVHFISMQPVAIEFVLYLLVGSLLVSTIVIDFLPGLGNGKSFNGLLHNLKLKYAGP